MDPSGYHSRAPSNSFWKFDSDNTLEPNILPPRVELFNTDATLEQRNFNPFSGEPSAPYSSTPTKNNHTDYTQPAKTESLSTGILPSSAPRNVELRQICTFALKGNCRNGERCRFAHGQFCPICTTYILHPDQTPEEHQAHFDLCQYNEPRIDPDDKIECCICLEKVKSTKSARFGLLSCEHPFCLDCIRHWRSNSGMDSSLLRTCPICRSTSFFIIPSYTWISDKEEKEALERTYKANLKSIPCKHFNYGEGQCPFGTSCFYDHIYPDGTRQEVLLRKIKTADDEMRILNEVKLSDFFETYNPQI